MNAKLQITQGREIYIETPYTSHLTHGDKYGSEWCIMFGSTSAECTKSVHPPYQLLISRTLSDPNGIEGYAQVPIINPAHTDLMPAPSECYGPAATTPSASPTPKPVVHTATVTRTTTASAVAHGSNLSTGGKIGIGIGVPIGALLLIALGVCIGVRRASQTGTVTEKRQMLRWSIVVALHRMGRRRSLAEENAIDGSAKVGSRKVRAD